MSKLRIGLCGVGTVGSSVAELLSRNGDLIEDRSALAPQLVHVGARREPSFDTAGIAVSSDIFAVAEDPGVDVVVELIGGTTVAKDLVLKAIANGKHVVTANKALIAEHGNEILAAAAEKNVELRFEAAVAGGIPVIRALTEGLSANRFSDIAGIINGTGNYILTEMSEHGRDYADALADAQRLGYAEADPTFDVEGIDAAQKLVILAALAFGVPIDAEPCYTEGISKLTVEDIHYASELGYRIKHLGLADKTGDSVALRVYPALVADDQLLSQVSGVMNAVYVRGDAVGPTLYYGAGAGGEATASAVISDIVSLARQQRISYLPRRHTSCSYVDIDDTVSGFYLRINVTNKAGALAEITRCLGAQDISVEALHQSGTHEHRHPAPANADAVPVVLITNAVREGDFRKAAQAIEALEQVVGEIVSIRIAGLD